MVARESQTGHITLFLDLHWQEIVERMSWVTRVPRLSLQIDVMIFFGHVSDWKVSGSRKMHRIDGLNETRGRRASEMGSLGDAMSKIQILT